MRTGDEAPHIPRTATLLEALFEMSRGRMGMTAVLDDDSRIIGIFTDGDLRRALEKNVDLRTTPIAEAMKRSPRTISADKLAAEAVDIMERNKVNQMLVVDEENRAGRRAQHARPVQGKGDLIVRDSGFGIRD